ncbi:unnamed protein product [Linum tenue]|uniref:Uncharacterized protein n=1 Tax=Linum tenue TaxID=586396 RepID=A0AAV0L3P1_9ROSI|nr:unnamed protein product [Linum tenue]CAI0428865.1 unnamed protein product [Linum tenue]
MRTRNRRTARCACRSLPKGKASGGWIASTCSTGIASTNG